MYVIFYSIADLFAFIPLLINYYREKKSQKEEQNIVTLMNDENSIKIIDEKDSSSIDDQSPEHYEVQSSKQTKKSILNPSTCYDQVKIFLILAVIFLFQLLARSFYFIYHISFDTDNEEVSQKFAHDFLLLIDISMRFSFYRIFFKFPFKKHHILSMVVIIFIFLVLIVLDILYLLIGKQYDFHNCLKFVLILSIRSILFPLCDTICKKIMVEKFLLPWSYMFRRGVYELIYLLILTLILFYKSILNFTLDMFTSNFWAVSTIYIFAGFIKSGIIINLIYQKSPTFVSFLIMSEPVSGSINEVINFIIKREKNYFSILKTVIEIIFFVLIVLTTLTYEEIIVIRGCGLDWDIKEEIRRRGIDDFSLIHENNDNDDDENIYKKKYQNI